MNTRRLLQALETIENQAKGYSDFQVVDGCCEPSYDDKPVILADWNYVPSKLFDLFEKYGYSCEWQDEWITCDSCYKAFRSSPDSYNWEMYGYIGDGYAICGDCIDWDEYLESMENEPTRAVSCSLFYAHKNEIESRYTLILDDFENGWHEGMNADPKKILTMLLNQDSKGRYLFVISEQSQFYITFAVYKKNEEQEEESEFPVYYDSQGNEHQEF